MSDCPDQSCCDTNLEGGSCCQPNPFDYSTVLYPNTRQCFTATCSSGQVGEPKTRCVPAGVYERSSQALADAEALAETTRLANLDLVCTCSDLVAPTISPADGAEITWPQLITITHPNPSVQIFYKTFATPYVLYTAPFILNSPGTQVTAYASISSCQSPESEANYTQDVGCRSYGGSGDRAVDETIEYLDPCVTPVGFQIKFFSGGVAQEITAPGNSNQYATEAECSAANNGARISFYHSGGLMSVYLKDNPYDDNIPGTPTPRFKLIASNGDQNTVQPDIFSNTESYFCPTFGTPGITPMPPGNYIVEYVDGAMKYNSGFNWSVNFAIGNRSETFQSGPYSHENLLAVYNLFELFPYAQMWDGECPIECRESPRQHTSGNLIIGPFSIDVEIFSITALFFGDDYSFDSQSLPYGVCGRNGRPVCPNTILKGTGLMGGVLTAGSTCEFKVWDTDGAHSFAVGYMGVRAVGSDTECSFDPPEFDTCACSESPTIEKLMRATQERYRLGKGLLYNSGDVDYLSWPPNSLSSPAGEYPVDGFYDGDLDAEKILAIKAIRDNIVDSWLLNYSPVDGLDGVETAPFYTEVSLLLPDPDWGSITLEQAMEVLQEMRGCMCQLFNIIVNDVESSAANTLNKIFSVTGNYGSCDGVKAAALAGWEGYAAPDYPNGIAVAEYPKVLCGTAFNGTDVWTAIAESNYGRLEKDLTNYGVGSFTSYAAMVENTDGIGYLSSAPEIYSDGKLHIISTGSSGSNYQSDFYGETNGSVALFVENNCPLVQLSIGWRISKFCLLVIKSNIPSVGDWVYYP